MLIAYGFHLGREPYKAGFDSDGTMDTKLADRYLLLLKEGGVKTLTNWKLERIDKGTVHLADRNWNSREVATDSVVLAFGLKPKQELLNPLKQNFEAFFAIGDCVEPRKIYQAVHEGAFVGRAIY